MIYVIYILSTNEIIAEFKLIILKGYVIVL